VIKFGPHPFSKVAIWAMNELDRRAWGDSRHERSIGLTKGRAATGRDVHIVSKVEDDLGIFVCLFICCCC
jgi:hypothetical protein